MLKGLYYKILSTFFMISLLLINIAPFSIKADYLGTAPYVGFNIWVEDYDNEYNISLNSGTGTLTVNGSNSSLVLGQFTSNGKTYWSTGQAPSGTSGMNINGTITLNQSSSSTQVVRRVIHVDIILDNDYVGYIRCRVRDSNNTNNVLFNQQLAVNGNSVSFQYVDTNSSTSSINYIVSFDEQFLIKNNNNERWEFPIESLGLISNMINRNLAMVGINDYNLYQFPIFDLKANDIFFNAYLGNNPNNYYSLIFMCDSNIYSLDVLKTYLDLNGLTILNDNFWTVGRFINGIGYIHKLDFIYTANSFNFKVLKNFKMMPIYFGQVSNTHISTDFALNFGLSNPLLDNLNIIANGNQGSNNSVNDNDNNNQLLDETNSEYEAIEQQFNENMNDSLDDINMQSDLLSNQDFLNSASFVKTQFNRLLNNTILGSLITFFLLLGLASIFIGRNK